jgi:hypothetical protein
MIIDIDSNNMYDDLRKLDKKQLEILIETCIQIIAISQNLLGDDDAA